MNSILWMAEIYGMKIQVSALKQLKLLPDASNMKFSDIKLLSLQLQTEWLNTCHGELEDLQKRQVYELVDLPLGRKAIDNKWVFLIKADGRK